MVVPVYQVRRYLAACLDSLLTQEFGDLEIIVVDDGSTDGSAAIAARYAAQHQRIRVVRTDNHGLGAARNHGARQAAGEYLAFADSDDVVPPYAYALLVSTLEESGSDLVVGSVLQWTSDGLTEPAFLRPAHRRRRLRVSLDEHPAVMHNVFAWDKVFRRAFWERERLAFPEGVRYEDQGTMLEAYLRAGVFDVVVRPVYHWRVRDDGSSITQHRHELADLRDRLVTKQQTTDVVRRLGSAAVLDYWVRRALVGDLGLYFREIPGCDEEYWELIQRGICTLFEGLPPIEESALRLPMRVVGWLVTRGRRTDAERMLAWVAANPGPLPLRVDGAHVVAQVPFADDPSTGIPTELFWLHDDELEFDARAQQVRIDGDDLVLSGIALIRGAPTAGVDVVIGARLESSTDTVALPVTQRPEPEATDWIARPPQVYDDSGFAARVSMTDLASYGPQVWALRLDVQVGEIRRAGPVRSKDPRLSLPPAAARSGVTLTVAVTFDRVTGLIVTVA